MEYLSEKSNTKRAKKELAMPSIFDEIIHKYSQSTSIENMQPGQTIKGTDGVSYTVVKDNTSGEKFFAPQQGQPAQQQEQQIQQPQDPSQLNQDPNQYAMQPSGADKPDENKPEPMGAKTSKRAQALQGLTDQDWSDIKSMGSDISQYAEKQDMKGIMEVIEDLTDLTLSFINLPENI